MTSPRAREKEMRRRDPFSLSYAAFNAAMAKLMHTAQGRVIPMACIHAE
jgi:hypothetical protein